MDMYRKHDPETAARDARIAAYRELAAKRLPLFKGIVEERHGSIRTMERVLAARRIPERHLLKDE